jgi:hypothetical protein
MQGVLCHSTNDRTMHDIQALKQPRGAEEPSVARFISERCAAYSMRSDLCASVQVP